MQPVSPQEAFVQGEQRAVFQKPRSLSCFGGDRGPAARRFNMRATAEVPLHAEHEDGGRLGVGGRLGESGGVGMTCAGWRLLR